MNSCTKCLEFFHINYNSIKNYDVFILENLCSLKNFNYLNELCNNSYKLFESNNIDFQNDTSMFNYILKNWDFEYIKIFFKIIYDLNFKINKKILLLELLTNLSDSFLEESIQFYSDLISFLLTLNFFNKSLIFEQSIVKFLSIEKVFYIFYDFIKLNLHNFILPYPLIFHCIDNIKLFDFIYNDAINTGIHNDKISNPNIFDFYSNNKNLQFNLDYILSTKYKHNFNWKTYLKFKLNKDKLEFLKDLYIVQQYVEDNKFDKLNNIFEKYKDKNYCINPNTRVNHNYPLFYFSKNTNMLLFLSNYGINLDLESTYYISNIYKINFVVLCKNNIEILFYLYKKGIDFNMNKKYLKKFTSLSNYSKKNFIQYQKLLSHSNKFIRKEKHILKTKLQDFFINDILNYIINFV